MKTIIRLLSALLFILGVFSSAFSQASCNMPPYLQYGGGWENPCSGFSVGLYTPPYGTPAPDDLIYQWQDSPDGVTFADIPGQTSATLTMSYSPNMNHWFRAQGTCPTSGAEVYCPPFYMTGDTYAPSITCPDWEIHIPAEYLYSSTPLPDLTPQISAWDNCISVTVAQDIPIGTLITQSTSVVFTATDASGNTATCSVIVVLQPNVPLVATCASYGDNTVVVWPTCDAPVPNVTMTASGGSGSYTYAQSPASGSSLTLGVHTITGIVTDGAGATASCTSTLTVIDATAPTLTCPAGPTIEIPAEYNCVAPMPDLLATTTATDNCSGVMISQDVAAGTMISANTNVTLTATDMSGNTATCQMMVTLPPGILLPPVVEVTSVANTGTAESPNIVMTATIVGACPNYYPYEWATLDPNATITAIGGGIYSVTVSLGPYIVSCDWLVCPPDITLNADPTTCAAMTPLYTPLQYINNCGDEIFGLQHLAPSPLPSYLLPGVYSRVYSVFGYRLQNGQWIPFVRSCTQKITVLSAVPNIEISSSATGSVCCGTTVDLCASMKIFCPTAYCPTYQWNNGSTAPCIKVTVNSTSTYIVTITLAPGITTTKSITIAVTPCTATITSFSNRTINAVTVNFNITPCASGYEIQVQRKPIIGGSWVLTSAYNTVFKNAANMRISGLSAAFTYRVRVRAICCGQLPSWTSNFSNIPPWVFNTTAPTTDTATPEALPEDKTIDITQSQPIIDEGAVIIMPNPAQDETTVTWDSEIPVQSIDVHDITGRVITSLKPEKDANQTRIDLSSVPAGVFIITILWENGLLESHKVVKE